MRLLLDTHVVLWALADDDRLTPQLGELISDGRNSVAVSAASVWDIAIKAARGKLDAPDNLLDRRLGAYPVDLLQA